jgi:hypothetical protein
MHAPGSFINLYKINAEKNHPVLYLMLLFSFPAIVVNIGADIAGMGTVGNLLFPSIHATYFSISFTAHDKYECVNIVTFL